jgi:small subunit ribosomal protein S6
MRHYETNFIVKPVLSGDEVAATAQSYVDFLQKEGCEIVHVDEMGMRPLAYPIENHSSGVYYCIEFQMPTPEILPRLELTQQRDERVLRNLTIKLDKHGVKYNDDKRKGLIGKKQREAAEAAKKASEDPEDSDA